MGDREEMKGTEQLFFFLQSLKISAPPFPINTSVSCQGEEVVRDKLKGGKKN